MQTHINMTGKNYTKVGIIKIEGANKIEKKYIDIISIYFKYNIFRYNSYALNKNSKN